jgi:hypothetical protein
VLWLGCEKADEATELYGLRSSGAADHMVVFTQSAHIGSNQVYSHMTTATHRHSKN